MHNMRETWAISLAALTVSAIIVAVFLVSCRQSPLEVFSTLYVGAFGSWFSWQNTLVRAAPLMLTAFCTLLPARVGYIVIGGEGAFVIGGLMATLTGITLQSLNPYTVLTAMVVVGGLFGGLWILIVGALRTYRQVNETISSLLLNYIAIAILNFLVVGILKDPATLNNPSTASIGEANMLTSIGETSIHWGIFYGLSACIGLFVLCRLSSFGFAMDIVGGNTRAARLVGLPLNRIILLSCFLGGACAGIAGMLEVAAIQGRANSSLAAGYGYAGILVAFLARQNPLAVIPYAILLGGIQASGGLLQRNHNLPDATTGVIQGIIFMVILTSEIFYGRYAWLQTRPKQPESKQTEPKKIEPRQA
ncbi:MAG TPA: ABC transporter permease [Cellvibrionaceae bacterium]